jgi:hypothetical protein
MRPFISINILVFMLSFLVSSCNENQNENKVSLQAKKINTSLYGDQNFIFPEFSKGAKIEVSHWGAYEDFDTQMKSLNGNTIESLQEKIKQVVFHLDSLSKKIPDTLNTQSIFSRVLVVKTRISLLDQELNKSRIDSIQLQDYIDEMNTSFKNLIIQINEKFEKDAIDLQKIRD